MITIHRAADRFRTEQPGITTYHSFSSGAHYDPANLAFGPVIACDEHLLDPGAGFAPHRHARVELLSWVVEGGLQHEDAAGRSHVVVAGRVQWQLAGSGIEHAECNASEGEPLHFVQLWLHTGEDVTDYDVATPPVRTTSGSFDVLRACAGTVFAAAAHVHLFVGSGRFAVGATDLGPGDSARVRDEAVTVTGAGELLVVRVET